MPKTGTTKAKTETEATDSDDIKTNDIKTKDTDRSSAQSSFQATRERIDAPSEPVPPKPETPTPSATSGGSKFWPLVIGGMVAAALGFAASEANLMGFRVGNDDIRAELTAQADRIAELENAPAPAPATEGEPVDLGGIEGELADLSDRLAAYSATTEDIEARIAALEDRPVAAPDTGSNDEAAAYAAELSEMQAALQQQRSEIEGLLANAQSVEEATAAAARSAAVQAAISKLTAAISAGSGYADVLSDLEEAGVSDLPEPLVSNAADGVVTLSNLQTRYPDAARNALSAARAAGLDGEGSNSVGGFLRRQLGARSVQPREGDDPDAVLSRAEAAVRDGRLSDALNEIDGLPDDVRSAMAEWLSDARARVAARSAVNDLSQRLTAN